MRVAASDAEDLQQQQQCSGRCSGMSVGGV
jgi:hypothetical protein